MATFSIDMKSGSLKKESNLIVGIDLGTTNSLVAYMKDDVPVTVRDESGKNALVPSIVHFSPEGHVVVGESARLKLTTDPANTIYSVKRLMGKSYKDVGQNDGYFGYQILEDDTESLVKIRVGERFFTPIELSAEILKHLKKRMESHVGETISRAVITVPAYFNDAQRQATRDAGKLAGLDVLRIINEPTAASLAYGIGLDKSANERVAVYDLGGGTFDISILHIEEGVFEVLATNGDTFLGGDDFDRAIIDHWADTYQIAVTDPATSQTIRLMAEEAKKKLSVDTLFESELGGIAVVLSRETLVSITRHLVDKTIQCCAQAMRDASLHNEQIDRVVLVGGSTRMPFVKDAVAAFFGKPIYDKLNPDEVVALGAAIQADVLAGNQKEVLLLDVTPLSLGIETVGGLMDTIIPRNNKIPTRVGRRYTTSVDGQKNLKVAVFQGERDLVASNRKLGEFTLNGIPPMPAGIPQIEIQFILDADGILKVKAKELRSGVEQEVEIRSQYGISEEEMALMLMDSIKHAKEDMVTRSLLEARNEGSVIVLSARKFMDQHADILSTEEKNTTSSLTDSLEAAIAGDDKDIIHAAINKLNEYTAPLAHRAMDSEIGKALKGKTL